MGQKLAEYDSAGSIIGFYDAEDSPSPEGVAVIGITDDEWRSCSSSHSCTVINGAIVVPAAPSDAQIAAAAALAAWVEYQARAQTALDDSDRTVLRCYENAVTVPAAWAAYRKSLRAIVAAATGDATVAFPVKPGYPAGT